jgi:hypothetical protein
VGFLVTKTSGWTPDGTYELEPEEFGVEGFYLINRLAVARKMIEKAEQEVQLDW